MMLDFKPATTSPSQAASELLQNLQNYFVKKLEALKSPTLDIHLKPVSWLRDQGIHGGGVRYGTRDTVLFDRASLNFSQVHYEDLPEKALNSATALSTIVHPRPTHVPSLHMHISFTELKSGRCYWRLMADLNPAAFPDSTGENLPWVKSLEQQFRQAIEKNVKHLLSAEQYEHAIEAGNSYFYIPALAQHRGVFHFYLEAFSRDDFALDSALANALGTTVIDSYTDLIAQQLKNPPDALPDDFMRQLNYHTLYFFQVMTLDRGTTSGLLVHNQNDVGILGSLPSHVNISQLKSWVEKMPGSHGLLLKDLIQVLAQGKTTLRGEAKIVLVSDGLKPQLAEAVRQHYMQYPENLKLQAAGKIIPPTVANHR